jgi:hypothetical protein
MYIRVVIILNGVFYKEASNEIITSHWFYEN